MGALTADRNTVRVDSGVVSVPVAATTVIFGGSIVCDNGSGYAIPAVDTSSLKVIGIASGKADNDPGSAGDISVLVEYGRAFWLKNSGLTIADRGSIVFADDDQTVRPTAGQSNNPVGILLDVDSSKGALVFIPNAMSVSGTVAVDLTVGNDVSIGRDLGLTRNALIGGTLGVTGIQSNTARINANGGVDMTAAAKLVLSGTTGTGLTMGRTGQTNTSAGPMVCSEGCSVTAGKLKAVGVLATDGLEAGYSHANTAAPPVIAEATTAFGIPAAGRDGFLGILHDDGGVAYLIAISNGVYYQLPMTLVNA